MTTPVYMKNEDKGSMMEFVLPSKYDMKNVSMPLSSNVEIYLDEGVIMHQFSMVVTQIIIKEKSTQMH